MTGGIFTREQAGKQYGLRRGKDIPAILGRCADANAVGFVGSDTVDELAAEIGATLTWTPLFVLQARFGLGCANKKAPTVRKKIENGESLVVATSNPNRARSAAEQLGFAICELVILGGSIEASEDDDPNIDAFIDIISSGNTLRDNGRTIVFDDLASISIGALWKRKN